MNHSENSTPFAGTNRIRFEGLRLSALSAPGSGSTCCGGTALPCRMCLVKRSDPTPLGFPVPLYSYPALLPCAPPLYSEVASLGRGPAVADTLDRARGAQHEAGHPDGAARSQRCCRESRCRRQDDLADPVAQESDGEGRAA